MSMRSRTGRGIRPGIFVELAGLNELGRLACALERIAIPVFSGQTTSGRVLAVQLDMSFGSPVFYYVRSDKDDEFLAYRNSGGVEEVIFTSSAANPIYTYAPMITIKEFPHQLSKGLNASSRRRNYPISLELNNLSSLAKISSYRTLFEEPPLPLFVSQLDGKHILAAFTRMNEYEETSICFYLRLDTPISNKFLKYSAQRSGSVVFTDRTDEHGFIYVKIIQLKAAHPLLRLRE